MICVVSVLGVFVTHLSEHVGKHTGRTQREGSSRTSEGLHRDGRLSKRLGSTLTTWGYLRKASSATAQGMQQPPIPVEGRESPFLHYL